MSLIGGIVNTVLPGSSSTGQTASEQAGNSNATDPADTGTTGSEPITQTQETDTSSGGETGTSGSSGSNATSYVSDPDDDFVAAIIARDTGETREDEVTAVDFARRAAIAAQAKAKTESLLAGLSDDPFNRVAANTNAALSGYGKGDITPLRFVEKMEKDI